MKTKIFFPIFVVAIFTSLASLTTVERPIPTNMRVTVLNSLGNIEEGVNVAIYNTREDYENEVNEVQEPQVTDKKGRVTFKKLEPKVYYIYATKGDMSNIGHGVRTDTLKSGRVNQVTIIIE